MGTLTRTAATRCFTSSCLLWGETGGCANLETEVGSSGGEDDDDGVESVTQPFSIQNLWHQLKLLE